GKTFEELKDKITLTNWANVNGRIENFEFADGTKLNMNNLIYNSSDKNSTLTGTINDDIIYSTLGNNITRGGKGNDLIYGGSGNDEYYFSMGDGQDTIIDSNGEDSFVVDVNPLDLLFSKKDNELEISINGTNDKINIKNWDKEGKIEKIKLNENNYIDSSKIDELIQAISSFTSQNQGISWNQALETKKEEMSNIVLSYYNK
ncbi:MAG: hypothetical protein JW924_08325, partial [Fusobacteriaceae bacterium]|nr:hypothetical protein [Fusobacteriaceae bacterium]